MWFQNGKKKIKVIQVFVYIEVLTFFKFYALRVGSNIVRNIVDSPYLLAQISLKCPRLRTNARHSDNLYTYIVYGLTMQAIHLFLELVSCTMHGSLNVTYYCYLSTNAYYTREIEERASPHFNLLLFVYSTLIL